MKNRWKMIWTLVLCAATAWAEPDSFGLGTGRDSALFVTQPGTIINRYAEVTGPVGPGDTVLSVSSAEGFAAGDLVMVLQTVGALPEPRPGDARLITLRDDSIGQWELARLSSADGQRLMLTAPLTRSFAAVGAQVIRVPEYTHVRVLAGASLVAAPWDGSAGGVLAFLASGTIHNEGVMEASGAGFRSGQASPRPLNSPGCVALPIIGQAGAGRGEGVSLQDGEVMAAGQESASNGGGGGLCPASGGGGGGHGGPGGNGGDALAAWDAARTSGGGQGGAALSYFPGSHLSFGGGGGQGYTEEGASQAGEGGGAVYIRGYRLLGNGTIAADGAAGVHASRGGAGGGGAGGSVSLHIADLLEGNLVSAQGGAGGSALTGTVAYAGPGGGGGGGRILYQATRSPAFRGTVEAGLAGDWQLVSNSASAYSQAQPTASQASEYRGTITQLAPEPLDTTIGVKPNNPTNQRTVRFTFSANQSGAGFDCTLDGTPYPDCTSPWPDPKQVQVGEGTHVFNVRAKKNGGEYDTTPAVYSWKVDLTPPETTITGKPPNPSTTPSATFEFTADEAGCGFDCTLDGTPYPDCTSPKAFSNLKNGTHVFQVRAKDPAGNYDSSPDSYLWVVNTPPPETTITSHPPNPSNNPLPTFTFTGGGIGFDCTLDGKDYPDCSSPWTPPNPLSEGLHNFQVSAKDAAGNSDPTPATYSWVIDIAPPDTTITGNPPKVTKSTSATFTFSSTGGGSGFDCNLDGKDYLNCSSPWTTPGVLGDGTHVFEVSAKDSAGNVDPTPASYTWEVDTAPPDTTINQKPPNPTNQTSATFTFSGAGPGGRYWCKLDEGNYELCDGDSESYSDLGERVHTFCVYAEDAAGNVDTSPSCYTWVVDLTPPDTSIIETSKPRNPTNVASVTFRFTGAGTGGKYRCNLDSAGFQDCSTGSVTYTGLSEKVHKFEVYAEDVAGNKDDQSPATYSWQVDTTKPNTVIEDPKPANPTSSTTATFRFSGADLGGKYSCKLDEEEYVECNAGSITYRDLVPGSHTFSVYAEDAAGNVDDNPATHTWVVDVSVPATVIDPTSKPRNPTNQTSVTFRFSGAGEGGKYRCWLDNGVEEACDSGSKTYSSLGGGPHMFCVYAINAAGTRDPDAECHSWVVDVIPPDTVIDATSKPRNPTNSTSFAFRFTSVGEGIKFRCKIDTQSEVDCDDGTFTGTVGPGIHTFSVYAIDAADNADGSPDSYTWVVDTTPPSTVITDKPRTPINERVATFLFSGADPGGTYECILDGNPRSCNSGRQEYTNLAEGSHTFCVYATDAAGNRDQTGACYTWVVDVTPPDTAIVEASKPPNPTNQTSVTFRFEGAGTGEGYYCKLDNGIEEKCDPGSKTYTGLTGVEHTFQVRAYDPAGNIDPTPASYSWTVDLTLPIAKVTSPSTEQPWSNKPSPSFVGTAEPLSEVRVFIDGQTGYDQASASSTGGWSVTTALELKDGPHTVEVQAIDKAGNVGPRSAPVSFIVDTVAPDTVIAGKPPEIHNLQIATFQFKAIGPDGKPEEGAKFACVIIEVLTGKEVDGECSESEKVFNLVKLFGKPDLNGKYTVSVRARDPAGNEDALPASYTWNVIVDPPKSPVILEPVDGAVVYALTQTISGKAAPDGRVDLTITSEAEGEKVELVRTNPDGSWTFTAALPVGTYSMKGIATDRAGNVSEMSKPITFTVVAPKPQGLAMGGGLGCAASGAQPGLVLLGLLAGALWNSRKRRR